MVIAMSRYSQTQGIADKSQRVMETVVRRASFYRENPNRFAKDYLGIQLKLFQEIILVMMNVSTKFMFLACRGQMASLRRNAYDKGRNIGRR